MIKMTKDKSFYRSFFVICTTLMLEQAVVLSVNLADNLMLGNYSETALSGVAAVNQVQFVLQSIVGSVSNGMVVLGSQYFGNGEIDKVKRVSSLAMRIMMGIALLLFAAVSLFPQGVMGMFTEDAAIAAEGIRYLNWMRFSYFFFGATTVMLGTMRIGESVKIALIASCVALVVNCSINYLLIAGHFGFPELGVVGAAIGTLAARVLEFFIVLYYLLRREKMIRMRLSDFLHIDRSMVLRYIKVSYPIVIAGFIWGAWNAVQTMVLGHMNDNAIAAQSISSTVFLLLKVTSMGASSAATVITGKLVGGGAPMAKIREYCGTMQVLFLSIGTLMAAIMLLLKNPILQIYDISGETYELANAFMIIQAIVLFLVGYQMPNNYGVVRGGGNTRFGLILDISLIVCFEIPASLLAAFALDFSPVAVFAVLNLDQFLKCFPAIFYTNSYKWVRRLTEKNE